MANKVLPNELMNSVLGYLYDMLTTGDDVAPKSEDNYLAWCTPGIPFLEDDFDYMAEGLMGVHRKDPAAPSTGSNGSNSGTDPSIDPSALLAQDANRKYMQAENFARLADMIPDTSGVEGDVTMNVWHQENILSQAYYHILKFSQVAEFEIDDATKKKIEKFRGLLQTRKVEKDLITDEEKEVIVESPLVVKYNEKMQKYLDTVLEYNNYRIAALSGNDPGAVHYWAINGPVLRNKVKAALNDWETTGYKNQYEQIAAYISQIEGRSMALLKANYLDDYDRAKLTGLSSGSDFLYATMVPGNFAKSTGWTTYKFSKSTYDSKFSYKKKKGTGGVSLNLGIFHLGGGGGYTKEESHSKIDTSRFRLSFEIAQVPIVRPWFNVNFLTSKYWRFSKNNPEFKDNMVSDGATPPNGMIPAFATTCLFVRNLKLDFGESHSTMDSVKSMGSGGGYVGWGPFIIGGRYQSTNVDREVHAQAESQGIYIPGLQLIGFKCHTLPKGPDPHPDIREDQWI
jgi:hypothetical protein